jgi:hypothetical protein
VEPLAGSPFRSNAKLKRAPAVARATAGAGISNMNKSILLATTALCVIVDVETAFAQIAGGAPVGGLGAAPEMITITAQRLNDARNGIQTDVGASTYSIGEVAIQSTPGGDNTLLN